MAGSFRMATHVTSGMARQKGLQVFPDADGSDAGAAATVRYAKCLVQVQMGNICTELPGAAQPTRAFRLAPSR